MVEPRTLTIQRALLAGVAASILVGIVPAGIALNASLGAAIESRARDDLRMAAGVFKDHSATKADAMMMYAKEFAHEPGLAAALAARDSLGVARVIEPARSLSRGIPVVIGYSGVSFSGPAVSADLVARTHAGEMPVVFGSDGNGVWQIALAPVEQGGRWVGAAGFAAPVDNQSVGALSGLARTGVIVVARDDHSIAATTIGAGQAFPVLQALRAGAVGPDATYVEAEGNRLLAATLDLEGAGTVIFARTLDAELAMLPRLRRVAITSAAVALILALILGAAIARRVARPVAQLAEAASAMTAGTFDAPLPQSRIREVARVAEAFGDMRRALASRLEELRSANKALGDAATRLRSLQSDLLQRERLAATGRLVVQLAHEIRNPVANVRNCLELVRRRVAADPEAREFADLAINELLRMHSLAEQVLDANRPRDEAITRCDAVLVAREVATLSSVGVPRSALHVEVEGEPDAEAAIAPDALKQVLLSLVQNAREAMGSRTSGTPRASTPRIDIRVTRAGANVRIEVLDTGPGIPSEVLPKVFDPFFTTKSAVHGVGLGLFVAEGLVRTAGGELGVENRTDSAGACFQVVLPAVTSGVSGSGVESNLRLVHT